MYSSRVLSICYTDFMAKELRSERMSADSSFASGGRYADQIRKTDNATIHERSVTRDNRSHVQDARRAGTWFTPQGSRSDSTHLLMVFVPRHGQLFHMTHIFGDGTVYGTVSGIPISAKHRIRARCTGFGGSPFGQ